MHASGLALAELFGPLARELGPRAVPIGADPERVHRGASTPERAAFALRAAPDVATRLRPLIEGADGRLGPYLPPGWSIGAPPPTEVLLTCAWRELTALAQDEPTAALLVAAQRALLRHPPPPRIMGIVNVTPDSFSDGGLYLAPERAIEHGLALAAEGADVLDVGGESTRPRSDPVDVDEELRRVVPVVRGLARAWRGPISVDTRRAAVARAALDEGASVINDVSAGRADPGMLSLAAERSAEICLVHMQGEPATMQDDPRYTDVVSEVADFLRERVHQCLNAGIELPRILLDPGIGFGKRIEHNLEILRRLSELRSLSLPILIGVSRKSFIAAIAGQGPRPDPRGPTRAEPAAAGRPTAPADRIGGTAAAIAACVRAGVDVLRVHDVRIMAETARVARAIALPDSLPAPRP